MMEGWQVAILTIVVMILFFGFLTAICVTATKIQKEEQDFEAKDIDVKKPNTYNVFNVDMRIYTAHAHKEIFKEYQKACIYYWDSDRMPCRYWVGYDFITNDEKDSMEDTICNRYRITQIYVIDRKVILVCHSDRTGTDRRFEYTPIHLKVRFNHTEFEETQLW